MKIAVGLRKEESPLLTQRLGSLARHQISAVSLNLGELSRSDSTVAVELAEAAAQANAVKIELINLAAAVPIGLDRSTMLRDRIRADRHLVTELLKRTAQARIPRVTLRVFDSLAAMPSTIPIDEAATHALELFLAARFEAEQLGVVLNIAVGPSCFLNSPLAARDFVDHCNSPWIGGCLCLADACDSVSSAAAWIMALGRRMFAIDLTVDSDQPASAALWQQLGNAIRTRDSDCPIIVEFGDLSEERISERLARLRGAAENSRSPLIS